MKTEELKEKGLTDEQIAFVMAENGKDIAKVQKKLDDMTGERDKEASRANTAEETLKKFEGVDVDAIKTELADWKTKAEKAESDYAAKIADRDFDDLVKEAISGEKGLNAKAIRSLLDIDALKASKNQREDVLKAVRELKEKEDSKFMFAASDAHKEGGDKSKPHFTDGKDNGGEVMTKEKIMSIKDKGERQKAIAENMALFK